MAPHHKRDFTVKLDSNYTNLFDLDTYTATSGVICSVFEAAEFSLSLLEHLSRPVTGSGGGGGKFIQSGALLAGSQQQNKRRRHEMTSDL